MIAQHHDLTGVEDNLIRQILIKENQLRIAQEAGMLQVAEELHKQLSSLNSQLADLQEREFEVWMTLLEDD
ncbi:hypothetical protein G7B40_002030 [Aetokthonos hydrillicola Thurmond2011]|jgi:hypothetical protein|uniref:Uncharacterized protein n=1 Tax=Aetokthonos hydrillicola Thurmond2011 TaxID=2712845 RepID=A0AAP5I232_9CYAN|nr:hypothetical protein [Aetokthonos hydrillicola]MBO3462680.1 hypothetical protein [Aetokthonos hydrillicola CCALA 1050]MBW4588051.1 hypothetical protein [Aetokthonos hydrillicola CCALA 1050]MDR9893366.1 hypothetical protein [Aetokthonos hydrillicola Thurmond2011]